MLFLDNASPKTEINQNIFFVKSPCVIKNINDLNRMGFDFVATKKKL